MEEKFLNWLPATQMVDKAKTEWLKKLLQLARAKSQLHTLQQSGPTTKDPVAKIQSKVGTSSSQVCFIKCYEA